MGMTLEKYESSDLMAENEFLRKQLAEALKHRRMFEADYENRLKADLKAILVELQVEIDELRAKKHFQYKHGQEHGLNDALELIQQKINELKQESTTKNNLGVDCVARQDVERFIEGFINEYTPEKELEIINLELDGLKHLPPATPQEPRKGHWISRWYAGHDFHFHVCSECNEEFSCDMETGISINNYRYCPNCGAKMVEPQKSEDKE